MKLILLLIFFWNISAKSQEIIIDKSGKYFLMKSDGTFEELPKPSQGKKYVIKKKKVRIVKPKNKIFKKIQKRSRKKVNQGIR